MMVSLGCGALFVALLDEERAEGDGAGDEKG